MTEIKGWRYGPAFGDEIGIAQANPVPTAGLGRITADEDRVGEDDVTVVREADGARSVLTSRALRICEKSSAGSHRRLRIATIVIVLGILAAEGVAGVHRVLRHAGGSPVVGKCLSGLTPT